MKQMQGTDAVFLVCSLASDKAGIWQGVWEMTAIWWKPENELQKLELKLLCCHSANFRPGIRLKLFNVGPDSLVFNLPIIGL